MIELSADITVFDVAPTDDSTWVILVNGGILGAFRERKSAVGVATALAARHRPSRLLTRSSDGDMEAITPFVSETRPQAGASEETLELPQDDQFYIR